MTRRNNRKAAPDPDPLAGLEAELHRTPPAPAGDDGREALLGYVTMHPGATVREAILHRPPALTNRGAGIILRDLLAAGQLHSSMPDSAFHARLRLFAARPGPARILRQSWTGIRHDSPPWTPPSSRASSPFPAPR